MLKVGVKNGILPILIVATLMIFQNCGGYRSSTSRKDFLSQSSVFGSSSGRPSIPSEPNPPPRNPEDEPRRNPKDEPLDLSVVTYCSSMFTGTYGGNIMSTDNLELRFVDSSGNVACVYKGASWLKALRDLRLLKIEKLSVNCPDIKEGRYELQIKGPSTHNILMGYQLGQNDLMIAFSYRISDKSFYVNVKTNEDGLKVVAPANSSVKPLVLYTVNPGGLHFYQEEKDAYGCNLMVSPLLVRITKENEPVHPLRLTAPNEGKFFDILGENSVPYAHAPKQISWFIPSTTTQDYFLVLPDARGEVRGVNELFGDNTRGPDGLFAPNGYLALRKYDGRKANGEFDRSARDGVIDARDEVFSQLRLWSDENQDGVAQRSELFSLEDKGLESIELDYDSDYLETDQYGNETRFKSVAHGKDGRMHLVFDLWFVLKDFKFQRD